MANKDTTPERPTKKNCEEHLRKTGLYTEDDIVYAWKLLYYERSQQYAEELEQRARKAEATLSQIKGVISVNFATWPEKRSRTYKELFTLEDVRQMSEYELFTKVLFEMAKEDIKE